MIRYGRSIRFTPRELQEFQCIGLDFSDAKSQAQLERALRTWAELLAQERPDLLEKIARAMVEAKGLRADEISVTAALDRA